MHKPALLAAALAAFATPAWACEPCIETYDVQRTYDAADAVVVGMRVSAKTPGEGEGYDGPRFIEISVDKVLKGKVEGKFIRAKAWSGRCAYGITIPPVEPGVIFLARREDGTFDSVGSQKHACTQDFLHMEENRVTVEKGRQPVMLNELVSQLEKGAWKAPQ